ncbi:aldo/keto reductase [Botrimarina mediterranea]|uniref:General stress protein 69 n=1 Tax=Botrimarina mediterranea TaxID=2528022 RepID=A0A518K3I9_9BACT|nr:aldo/keto reductase [Botrimarina mediterranea]QDV72315.1 General stress protein 69 [Botrimarina mediterranea]QDV76859.1 General stress protein 69 [Planctomycetes bacterium K2D]
MPSPFDSASDRREFLKLGVKTSLATGAILAMADDVFAQQRDTGAGVPKRPLGKSGAEVSIVSLGGHHIGQVGKKDEDDAIRLMHRAIDEGVTFLDNAWDYHEGYSEELMGKGIEDRRDRVFLMTKVCDRDYEGAKKQLDESLKRLRTDHIDLWQFHEMVYDNDPDWVFDKGGIRAALEAQQAGKVKHIGFTGHKDPSIHLKMLGKPQQWASAQMPINVCDYHFRSFLHKVATECNKVGTGVIGMKCMGGGNGKLPRSGVVTGEECLHFALSQPVASVVTGMLNDRDLDQALKVARHFKPLSADEQSAILAKTKDVAADGRYELFKTSKEFDGPYHRKQHGFAV